jgi:hypothetical protein
VIVVNYEAGVLLHQCLASIEQQVTHFPFETIVVDNASRDGSLEGIAEGDGVRVIRNPINLGFASACNIGARAARGQWLLFLNPDTRLLPGNLQRMWQYLEERPEVGIAGAKVLDEDGSFQAPCRRRFPTPGAAFRRLFLPRRGWQRSSEYELSTSDIDREVSVDAVSGSYLWIRRSLFEQVGGFDEEFFLYGEDLDLCWRVREAGYDVRYAPVATAIHARGQSRAHLLKRSIIEGHRSMAIFYRKHYAAHERGWFNLVVHAAIWMRAGALLVLLMLIPSLSERLLAIGKPRIAAALPAAGTTVDLSGRG